VPAAKAASSAFSIIEEDDDETEDIDKVNLFRAVFSSHSPTYKTGIGAGAATLRKDAAVLLQL